MRDFTQTAPCCRWSIIILASFATASETEPHASCKNVLYKWQDVNRSINRVCVVQSNTIAVSNCVFSRDISLSVISFARNYWLLAQNMTRNLVPRLVQLPGSSSLRLHLPARPLNVITRIKFTKTVIWFIRINLASIVTASEVKSLARCKIAERRCKRTERIARPYRHQKENVVRPHTSAVSNFT